jgi:DNA-binding transcriptional MocR family regulator
VTTEIRSGSLAPGDRLPTVRALATALGTSPTTVSEAWRLLARAGAIDARGRNGTFVRGAVRPLGPRRYRAVVAPSPPRIDLSTGIPDPDLLPDMRPALARVSRRNLTTSYLDAPVLPALGELLSAQWPFRPEQLTLVDGAMDALDRIAAATLRFGDRVLVEEPGFPPIYDLLDQFGATPVGVPLNADGIIPDALRHARLSFSRAPRTPPAPP